MIDIITECIEGFRNRNFGLLTQNITDDCLIIGKQSSCLGKAKIVRYLDGIHNNYKQLSLSILNSVKDSSDTILISWVFRGIKNDDDTTSSIFGTSVVHFNEQNKIKHVKSTTVNA